MSKINGEKARAAIAKKRRTAQRAKDRAKLASIRAGAPSAPASTDAKSDSKES
jgi:hypothetical protein